MMFVALIATTSQLIITFISYGENLTARHNRKRSKVASAFLPALSVRRAVAQAAVRQLLNSAARVRDPIESYGIRGAGTL
jgi:hypothetical protein